MLAAERLDVTPTQDEGGICALPAAWHLPVRLDQLASLSSQQTVLQDLAPLLVYLFRAANLSSQGPVDRASSMHSSQPGPRQHGASVSGAAGDGSCHNALSSTFASLPGDWLQALMQLDSGQQDAGRELPQQLHGQLTGQLHGQLQRAWAALGNILERLTPDLRPALEAFLTTLAAHCKVKLTSPANHVLMSCESIVKLGAYLPEYIALISAFITFIGGRLVLSP